MTNLSQAYSEIKSLPDSALHKELSSPSGMIPGYLILSELNERRSLRSETPGPTDPQNIAQEYKTKGYAGGGKVEMLAKLNPFEYYTKALKNFHSVDATPPAPGGIVGAMPVAAPPMQPVGLETLIAQQPGIPGQPTPIGQPVMPQLQQQPQKYALGGIVMTPQRKAFLDAIAAKESPAYNVMYGGKTFSDYSQHPNVAVPITSGPNAGKASSAAGRYQFLGSTWADEQKRLGLPDFSPSSQDQAAWDLANRSYGGNLDAALTDPQSAAAAATKLHPIWTSLPGGIEQGQGMQQFANNYAQALGSPQQLAAGIPPDQSVATGAALQAGQTAQLGQAVNAMPGAGMAAADPVSGIMSLLAMQALTQQQQAPAPMAGAPPVRKQAPTDPVQVAEDTSMTPDYYRRRRAYYG